MGLIGYGVSKLDQKIVDEEPLSLSEAYKLLKDKLKDKELPPSLNPTYDDEGNALPDSIVARAFLDYLRRIKPIDYEKALEIKRRILEEVDWSQYTVDERSVKGFVSKIVDLLPRNLVELYVIQDQFNIILSEDDAKRIVKIVEEVLLE